VHIRKAREIINGENESVRAEFERRIASGKTAVEVAAEDPFLAGQMYALGSLTCKLIAEEFDEEHIRNRNR
jgi:hypothetical protein